MLSGTRAENSKGISACNMSGLDDSGTLVDVSKAFHQMLVRVLLETGSLCGTFPGLCLDTFFPAVLARCWPPPQLFHPYGANLTSNSTVFRMGPLCLENVCLGVSLKGCRWLIKIHN